MIGSSLFRTVLKSVVLPLTTQINRIGLATATRSFSSRLLLTRPSSNAKSFTISPEISNELLRSQASSLLGNGMLTGIRAGSSISSISKDEWKQQAWLHKVHVRGPIKPRKRRHPLDEKCQMKGVVLKTLIKKPKKPNSANRKCVLVRLTNGKEAIAYVPKIGHNLQEHSVVLVHKKRTRDVPGLKLRCIRGCYDLPHVVKRTQVPS